METDVDKLLDDYDLTFTPKLDGVVLDGDASTNSLVSVVQAAAQQASQQSSIKYCKDMVVRPCTNHLGVRAAPRHRCLLASQVQVDEGLGHDEAVLVAFVARGGLIVDHCRV